MSEIQPGTVIHGTHRNQDLIPALLKRLHSHYLPIEGMTSYERIDALLDRNIPCPVKDKRRFVAVAFSCWLAGTRQEPMHDDHHWWASEEASELVTILMDELSAIAPDGHYFGAHPGDGADFGFWSVDEED